MVKRGASRVVVLFLLVCLAASDPPRCTFPNDFSHRGEPVERWLTRVKRQVLINWNKPQWSTIHRRLNARAESSAWDVYESEKKVEEFMQWTLGHTPGPPLERRFSVAYIEKPWWREDGSKVLSSFAAQDLRQGDTILNLSLQHCLSDIWTREDPEALYSGGAPWEVLLASKLLRERSKGRQSRWAPYIKLLPSFIPLPIFFSELELINTQDRALQDEVEVMRKFAKSTFQALHVEEISGAKFGDYVWALSVVYSSACQLEGVKEGKAAPYTSHYLLPFFSGNSGDRSQVYAEYVDENLKLSVSDVKGGTPLLAEYASSTLRDTFLFHGFVPRISQQDTIRVFSGVLDLVDWYSSSQGSVNHNRYLTLRLARDSMETLTAYLQESAALSVQCLESNGVDFSIGANGYVCNYMISIFATLFYANQLLRGHREMESLTTVDFVVRNGTTTWEQIMRAIAHETVSRYCWNTLDCKVSPNSNFEPAFLSAKSLIQERLASFLEAFSTNLVEDNYLLAAAAWEGMNELEGDQLACPLCRWQSEQMSYHDNLAIQFRVSLKSFILLTISELSCGANITSNVPNKESNSPTSPESDSSLQKFFNWCEGHDLIISKRLAITEISYPAKDQTSILRKYRGVIALEDIHQGETLCTIPMNVGLYNNDSTDTKEVDAWDLAAARLLREKAKGHKSSYAPYIAILPDYLPTPIHLESEEVMEVQWLPMMREVVQVRKAIKESFLRLDKHEVEWADFSEYKWAVTMVHSRAFTLPVRGDEQYEQYVLMPFMDMINHHYRYKADWMSQDIWDSKLEIVARRTLRKGEELFASFGARSNDNLFLYYGFVLEENPFDSVPIFGSFEEALKWFLNLWTQNCTGSSNPVEESLCQQRNWQLHWSRSKDAIKEIESGNSASSEEWAGLLTYWADLGLQFLQYQPGPTIYPGGVIDPSFLLALSMFYKVMDNVTKENGVDYPWPDPCTVCGNNSAVGSPSMRKVFACIQSKPVPPRGLLNGHVCRSALAQVLLTEERLGRSMLLARISVAIRCSEILASFPTTVDEDIELLKSSRIANDCSPEDSTPCNHAQIPSSHLRLTWHYRYLKKLLLKATVDKLLN